MSIAYDFEPDVSPIYDDEFTDDFSVHFSSYGTPRSRPISNQQNQTMGASRMEMDHSEVNSDEVVPDSTVNSRQYEFEQGEEDDAKVLTGTYIVLSAGCCHPIKRHFLKNLEEMGATIQNHVDFQTTHVVIDRYANAEIVKEAMEKGDLLNMVDVKWIQDCVDKKKRLREKDYSMNDCHYLKQSCRRLSHVVDEHNESDFLNMTTSDLVEFIDQIKSLSERLDALMNYNPLIRFAYHSPDCPTRRRPTPSPAPPAAAKLKNVAKIRKNIEEMSNLSDIKRRRSFGGYVYAHRNDAMLDILRLQEANHDVRETWEPEKTAKKKSRTIINPPQNLKLVNDMRKTVPAELPVIHETYRNNANLTRVRKPASNMSRTRSRIRRPVNPNDDPEIQKALGSMTINSSPDEMPRPASSRRKNVPLVVTKSKTMNNLMIFDSNDFISDISEVRKEEKNAKNAIVFTGFGKENIDELKRIAQEFELEISTELDEKKTKCVISRDGHRTLLVVKAICLDIPIVKPIWLEESEEDSKLLDADEYEYGEWKDLLKKRKFSKITFSNYRAIFVHRNCAPKRADICWMIEKCGGKITNKVEKSEIVIAPDNRDEEEETENYRRPVVSPIFVIDSITNNECLGIEDYTN